MIKHNESDFNDNENDFRENDSESDSNETLDIDHNIALKNQLRQWVSSHNITRNFVNELLAMLHPRLPFLPLDCRTLMNTPRKTNIIKLNNNAIMSYFGIEGKLAAKLKHGLKNNVNVILLQINIDGLPLFKSSSTEIYPILGLCNDLVDNTPFTIAVYCGSGKPDPIDIFLKDFITEAKKFKCDGLVFQNYRYDFDIHFFICDTPARAYLRQTVGHTNKNSCEKCTIVGTYSNHRVNFAQNTFRAYDAKLDSDFVEPVKPFYIKDNSPLLELGIKLVAQFPLDPMHLIYLGVVKRLLVNYYFDGIAPFKLSQKIKQEIDILVLIIRDYITSDFARKCRSFKEIRRWKATVFRLFIMYTGPVLLFNAVNDSNYECFILLHCAIFILSNSDR
ncbi:hypothetical protein NQ314_012682 [Rhamnusium bicolor]|uniref:Uncharacterized protein n=1 Tax=Rhamnusium bicolor TaxID=1586634 RepID=A0AAV8XAX4_9CUCU|nr:hypothetical protein NQ314_012682 [Rhamnusium bicolor]